MSARCSNCNDEGDDALPVKFVGSFEDEHGQVEDVWICPPCATEIAEANERAGRRHAELEGAWAERMLAALEGPHP